MKNKFDGFIWGMILIAAGGLFMARNLGYEVELTPTLGMLACGTLSALSFMRYFLSDRKRWGRLIPACVFAAFVVMIGLSEADVRDSAAERKGLIMRRSQPSMTAIGIAIGRALEKVTRVKRTPDNLSTRPGSKLSQRWGSFLLVRTMMHAIDNSRSPS